MDSSIQEEERQLTSPPKLKPRLHLIVKDPSQGSVDMTKSIFGDDDRTESNMTEADKSKYSGIGDVINWAGKLASSKPLHTLLSQHSASNSHYACCPATPMINNPPEAGTHDDSPCIQGSDTGECLTMSHPSTKTICHRMNAMAITNVISGSELDKSTPSPPPLSQYMHPQWGHSSSDAWKALRDDDNYVEPSAAAIAVITTFFAHDVDFEDLTPHMKFADAMLKKNWFLFSQNRGTDNKMWTGLWQALFILQTFTHHFNFIQGHADISALSNDFSGPHTALMLTSAAIFIFLIISLRCMVLILLCHFSQVCQTLSLVTEGHMSFKMTQLGNVWTATILKGGQFKFGKAVWDTMTRHYLEPIKELSDEQCGLIVEDTQKFMKKVTAPMASTLESVGEDELNDLFTFQ
ncbi:hypothetical protein EV401DRAFT_2083842 [Pisolithus croceorrhizus]|nr:hypothetical protein EV401DRAFT_2083842 [Pisolithus croceorrhizus]